MSFADVPHTVYVICCEQAGNLLLIEQTTMNPLNVSEASASPVPSEGPSKLGHRRSSVDEVIITTDPNYELLQTLTTDPDIQVGGPKGYRTNIGKFITSFADHALL